MDDDVRIFCLCVRPEATYTVERPPQGHREETSSALWDGEYHLCIKQQKSM